MGRGRYRVSRVLFAVDMSRACRGGTCLGNPIAISESGSFLKELVEDCEDFLSYWYQGWSEDPPVRKKNGGAKSSFGTGRVSNVQVNPRASGDDRDGKIWRYEGRSHCGRSCMLTFFLSSFQVFNSGLDAGVAMRP